MSGWEVGEPDSLTRLVEAAGTELGQVLTDAMDSAGVRHAAISPVAWLHAFPFGLLPLADGGLLGDVVSLSYAPSARVLQRLHLPPDSGRKGAVAVAYHDEHDIPLTSAEVAAVGLLHGDDHVLDGPSATPQRLLSAARQARYVHAACHGSWRMNDYFASGLHLAPTHSDAGYLSVARLHREADLSGVDLVVLSACDSGRSTKPWPTVELYTGIDGAFLARGARTVVSSLWEVHDLAGLLFSTALHSGLCEGEGIATSFSRAVGMLRHQRYSGLQSGREVEVLDESAPGWRRLVDEAGQQLTHPYFWGGFKLSGLVSAAGPASRREPPSS